MDRIKAVREAGWVQRMHTTPHHRPHTVAQHSWSMAAMLLLLHPDPSRELIQAALFHDVAERWTGDMPAPMKWWINPEIGIAMAHAEAGILIELGLANKLSEEETKWLRALDILDLYLYAKDELNLGNRHMQEVHDVCHDFVFSWDSPKEIIDWLQVTHRSSLVRTSDKEFNK